MLRNILLTAAAALFPVATASAGPAVPAAAGATRSVALDDINRIESPDGPYLSRDGRQVAYVVDKQIYVVPTTGGPSRAVTAAGSTASTPYWSKDGRALYFLSDRSGSSQLWKLPVAAFGEAQQVTKFEHGIDALNFSADDSQVLLSFTESKLAESADKETGKEKKPEPWVITRLEFKEDAGDGYLTGDRAEHLYAYELASGKLTQLTSGQFSESDAAWSPDGRSVVFTSNREDEPDASYKTDLWLVASDNTDRGQALTRLTNDDRVKSAPAWSPDGRFIAFLTAEDGVYGSPQLAVMPAGGRRAADPDRRRLIAGSTPSSTRTTASGCTSCSKTTAGVTWRASVRATAGWNGCSKANYTSRPSTSHRAARSPPASKTQTTRRSCTCLAKVGRAGSPMSTTRICARSRSATSAEVEFRARTARSSRRL